MQVARRAAQILARRLTGQATAPGARALSSEVPPPPSPPPASDEPCPVCSYNEWDPLEEVIVGRAEGSRVPNLTTEVKAAVRPGYWDWVAENAGKPYDPAVVQAAIKEADEFHRVLELEGVKVRRPEPVDYASLGNFTTPDFEEGGFISSCPRDSLVVFGDEIVESTMSWRSRMYETRPYKNLLNEYFSKGARWTQAPKPAMTDDMYDENYPLEDFDKRLELAAKGKYILTETNPCFDAADIMRFGEDVFIQISQTTNWKGYEWLRRHLAPKYRVHYLNFLDANALHMDATFVPLRPGLILANPERPCLQVDFFKKNGWEVVYAPKPTEVDESMVYASAWLSINVLSIDEERVVMYSKEKPLMDLLRKYGFKPIGVDMTNAFFLGGAFHCWTCDIRRKGDLKSYF